MADEFIFFDRRFQTSEDFYGNSQLDQDTTRYFPWVYDVAAHRLGWQWWGLHLLEEWQDLPHLTAPLVYENEYKRLRGQERTAWLTALRRVCGGAFEGAIMHDFDGEEEYYPLSVTLNNAYNGLKEELFKAIKRGLRKLDTWLSWREQSPSEQLLTVLSVLHLDVEDGSIVVPYPAPVIENGYFKALVEEFRLRLSAEPPTDSWLRILHSQLSDLSKLTFPSEPVLVAELPSVFFSLQWPNLPELPVLPTSPRFWLDLKTTLTTRAEWASRAVALVGEALGLPKLPVQKSEAAHGKFSLKQAAMFYYYANRPLTDNNKSELAAQFGHISTSSGILLMQAYAEWRELLDRELPDSKRQLGHLKKDLAKVLPHLDDKAADEVHRLLKRVAKKYERGL